MKFRKKPKRIPCYVLVFDQVEIIRKALDFLTQHTDRLDLIIVENPSPHTAEITKLIQHYGCAGLIEGYYLFDHNITGRALDIVMKHEAARIKQSPYIIMTDGDMTSPKNAWLDEELAIMKAHPEIFACGVTLDAINLPVKAFPDAVNWIPKDTAEHEDYYEVTTGAHLLFMRGATIAPLQDWIDTQGLPFVDSSIHRYCLEVLGGKWARTKKTKAYHLTWDLYNDPEHEYTKLKTGRSFKDTWLHQETSDFRYTDFRKN